ncbi:lanc-like protein gcl2 [Phtheirospermum japonicum]|uniref:Lanc-like protein gcl2 n=1 Tax=Phtheirospermum japonicum TaxID=374723 RepID=A0A830B1K4_9LAMI|nr:lanc-like protein gcl2 [Phtheirospermum japonicum]
MADRYFPNDMPDLVQENPNVVEEGPAHPQQGTQASLLRLLQLPHSNLSHKFQRAALHLKETIVLETWGLTGQRVENFTLYWGTMGTAFLLFKSFQLTRNKNDLSLCLEIVKACDSSSIQSRDVTFLCGRGGVCALGAVVAKYMNDDQLLHYYLAQFKEIRLSDDHPDELLYGRTGYLWSCLFLNKHLGNETIPLTSLSGIVRSVVRHGRTLGKSGGSPLMFEFHGERYWGAAHGLAGIMRVLMEFELAPDELEDVKGTLKYMIKNRFPSGNYPASEADKQRDVLVQWCRGASGIALTLVKAAEVFGDKEFLQAAMEAAEVVWNRGLLRRVGMCHGISGNAYVFLSLYRLTGIVEYLYRAKAFACFLLDGAHMLITAGELHGGDAEFSLFEGIGGMAHLFLDMVEPNNARFPAFEL